MPNPLPNRTNAATDPAADRERRWQRWIPGLALAKSYDRRWLLPDVAAGLSLSAMLVPAGIAYAVASGLPGIYGLYATIVPLLAYAVFGPSPILVFGPDSALSPLILATVLPLSMGDPHHAVALAGAMAIISGLICLFGGLLKLGFVTDLLSKPIRFGYMNGIALTVIISQLPKLLGIDSAGAKPLQVLLGIVDAIGSGGFSLPALGMGTATLALILGLKRFPRLPGVLIAVVAGTTVSAIFDLGSSGTLQVLGPVSKGLPGLSIPRIDLADLWGILSGSAVVAIVAFADTSALSRTFAARRETPVDPNQEMVALGLANLATGLFQGFPISSSASRTPVAEAAGAKTQMTGVVAACGVMLLLVFAPALLHDLPISTLAAVVIAAAIGLFEVHDLRRLYRIQRWEFWLSMLCFAGVVTLGTIQGIGLAILLAVGDFLWEAWRPYSAVLARVDGLRGYHDRSRYPDARLVPGLVIFRWDAPLFFANGELFRQNLLAAVDASPTPVRWVIVAAEPITSVDVTAADMLTSLHDRLAKAGITLRFAEMKDPVKDMLRRFGLAATLDIAQAFPTLGAGVDAYLTAESVDWVP